MRTRNIRTFGILLMSLLMVTAINAQSPRQGGRGLGLNLTEEQQAEITTLRTEHHKAITPLKNKMAELRAHERTLLSEENVDMKAVNKTIDEQTELSNSIRKLQVKQQLTFKELLSDEQVMRLQQHRQFAQRDGFHGKGGRRGAGTGRGYRGI